MFIYLIQNKETGHFKIGRSKNIKNRMRQLQTGSSGELVLVDKFETNFASKLESYLHTIYLSNRTNGEWFDLCYSEVAKFKSICETMERNYKFLEEISINTCNI